MTMKLVGYLRVSTDDKGQDPARQKAPILARAARDGDEVVGWVVDEGTSGAVSPFDRPKVREAIRLAKEKGAHAIVCEAVDRWSRGGWQDVGVSMYNLQSDHGLGLKFADLQGDDFVVELLTGILATIAKMNRKRLIEATKSGMENARRKGVVMGRPAKPDLSDDEYQKVLGIKKHSGNRRAAIEVSQWRGAHEVADAKSARFRRVSASWIQDQLAKRSETPKLLERVVRPAHRPPLRNGPISEQAMG